MIRRTVQLLIGLWMFGASIALLVRAGLGLSSWDVLHEGLAKATGVSIGVIVIATSVVVLLLWWPLRQKPGVGTVFNVLLVGLSLDLTLVVLPAPDDIAWQVTFLAVGIVANGVATGLYIGAGLGPGPRDGLMTGLATKGMSIRLARTVIEIAVLLIGWVLGGTVGVGTIAYALLIGQLAQFFVPLFTVRPTTPERSAPDEVVHRRR